MFGPTPAAKLPAKVGSDRIEPAQGWLTRDPTRPNPAGNGGILLGTFTHTGALAVGESYEQIVKVRVPSQIASGVYYITPWSDAYDVVLEDTLASNINPDDPSEIDNNNYKARRIDIIGSPVLLPDLQVISVTADAVGSTSAPFSVSWTVENHGEGDASGLTWGDSVYLSDVADIHAPGANVWLLGDFERPTGLASFERYTMTQVFDLSPAAQGKFVTVVTDTSPGQLPSVHESIETNNSRSTATSVVNHPADLRVTQITAPASTFSGEKALISWSVVNDGAPVWTGTRYWRDALWISAYPTFNKDQSTFLGTFTHSNENGLLTGQSYTSSAEVTLPKGVDGPFYLYVIADVSVMLPPLLPSVQDGEDTAGSNAGALLHYASHVFEPAGLLNNTGQGYDRCGLPRARFAGQPTADCTQPGGFGWHAAHQLHGDQCGQPRYP